MNKEAEKVIADSLTKELKRHYVRGMSHGYKICLNDILEASQQEGFSLNEYLTKQLKLRKNIDEPLDEILKKN